MRCPLEQRRPPREIRGTGHRRLFQVALAGEPEGDDTLNGGDGDDVLNDCAGHNRLDAGPGEDICQFDTPESRAQNCEDIFACA